MKINQHTLIKRVLIVISIPLQYCIIKWLKFHPNWVEDHFTHGFYNTYFNSINNFFSAIPFSVGDVLYGIAVLFLLKFIVNIIRNKIIYTWRMPFNIVGIISIFYFAFHISWGLNYYKLPLHKVLNIKSDYSTEELIRFTEKLMAKTNSTHCLITHDTLAVSFNAPIETYKNQIFEAYKKINFTSNSINRSNVKPSLLSWPLSYMGFGGYVNPFTLEAQYNDKVPAYKYPTLIAHEMGHQLGYAKENEANFVACYVTMLSDDLTIQYAGYSYALRFCLNEIFYRHPKEFYRLKGQLNPGVLKNYSQIQEFWESYNNPLEPVFKLFYGNFLKVNNQPQGIESYNYVVALLVNYF